MEIIKISKKGSNYHVTMDDGNKYILKEQVLIDYHLLKPKTKISDELFEQVLASNEYYFALDDAFKYLSRTVSKKDLKDHLLKKYSSDVTFKVVDKCILLNLIDELDYARLYIELAIKKGNGKNFIIESLKEKEIPSDIIYSALSEIDSNIFLEVLEKQIDKYMVSNKKGSKAACIRKIYTHFTQKGYDNDLIRVALEKKSYLLDNIIEEDESLKRDFDKAINRLLAKGKSLEENKDKVIRSLVGKGYPYNKIKALFESR